LSILQLQGADVLAVHIEFTFFQLTAFQHGIYTSSKRAALARQTIQALDSS
jgi:hypothetical protein